MVELGPDDPSTIGPYVLLGRLGSGGMGVVYLGRDEAGGQAAIKVIHPQLIGDPEFRARFAREIATAGAVNGPWIARVLASDPVGSRPWLATEYVDGPNLEEEVTRSGPLPLPTVLPLARKLAAALASLHASGVVHRDLKPSNVLLASDGPRLIDFGIARAVDATKITRTGDVIGTPAFMSPEQALGAEPEAPSDVFSLASILAFAATGTGPFGTAANPLAMLMRVSQQDPDVSVVPDELRPHLEACLARDPARRPTAPELVERLGAIPRLAVPELVERTESTARLAVPELVERTESTARLAERKLVERTESTAGPTVKRVETPRARRPRGWRRGMIVVSCALVAALVAAPAVVMSPLPEPSKARHVETRWLGEGTYDVEITRDGAHIIAVAGVDGLLVVDPATGAATARITPSASRIGGFAPAPDGKSVYAVEHEGIGRFDLGTGDLLAQFPVGERPYHPAVAPDGRTVYASGNDQDRIFAIDTATGAVRATEPLGRGPFEVVVSADSQTLYVTRMSSSQGVLVVDAASLAVVNNLALEYVTDISVAPDGSRVYVSCRDGIVVLDGRTRRAIGRFELPRSSGGPSRMVVSPDGAYLYAIDSLDPYVRVIETTTGQEVEAVPLEGEARSLAIAPDGRRLYVSEHNGDALWLVDTTAYTT
ncbi:protein kinase [Pseudonocardia sp. DSM 110487]|uniref:serine/threonine-protein kinase n=1 Tax=Pseudonocardia sp. DSM 110487 TaxID=2865833 RepID=UPI001C69A3A8|nr:serine/threonine-protein kinase [Pseudonocardia sp. DSM 110487]QYN32984.1 protein kinase [Pseudonocardia sp. DSM 110487]